MQLPEDDDYNSYNGLDNLSQVVPPESVAKSKASKSKDGKTDKKKKKKDKDGERQLKVKDLGTAGLEEADDDIDGIIQQQKGKFGDQQSEYKNRKQGDNDSNADNMSAGGTRYEVKFKQGGIKFYGGESGGNLDAQS